MMLLNYLLLALSVLRCH